MKVRDVQPALTALPNARCRGRCGQTGEVARLDSDLGWLYRCARCKWEQFWPYNRDEERAA